MKRFLLPFFAVLLLIVPVRADIRGVPHPRYAAAHVKVRAWIRALPRMVRTSARHVYLLSRSHFRLTAGRGELADTYGYYIHPAKDIYLWPTSAGRLKHTLYHEFGHAFDSRVRLHQYFASSAWRRLMRGDRVERFADVFADIYITITAPAYQYIFNLLYGG